MRTFFGSLRSQGTSTPFEREIAPGVTIRINRLPRSMSLGRRKPVTTLTDRVHAAWDVLWGKAHAMPSPIQQRLRRAA